MMSRKLTAMIASGITGLVLMTTAALASPAQSVTSLNVRSGPSTAYRVVDVLHPGEFVEVESCRNNGWCYVSHRGRDGWVSSRYLSHAGKYGGYRDYDYRDRHVTRSRRYPPKYRENIEEFQFRFGGPNFSFSFGTGDRHRPYYRDCYRRYGRIVCR